MSDLIGHSTLVTGHSALAVVLIELAWLDWAIIGAYMVLMFGIAFWALRQIKDCGAYLVGSRKLGKLMMIAASFAGGTNANHPMSVAAASYQRGIAGIWLSLTWILITPFFWLYPPVVRRLRVVTLADIVRMRFGRFMSLLLKTLLILQIPVAMGLGIKSAAIVLQVMTGGSLSGTAAEAIVVLPTLFYVLLGGIIAAYATDIYQSVLIVILSFVLIPFAILRAGGFEPLSANISDEFTSLLAATPGDFGFWWIFWFAIGITFSAVISSVGGAASARDENAARSGAYGLVIKRFCTVGWGLVGLFGMALYAGHPMLDSASGIPGAGPDNIFPLAAGDLLPIGLRGLMVASILAAVMSSLSAAIVGFGGMMVNNVYQEHFVRQATPRHYLAMARAFSAVGLFAGWWVASAITDLVEFSTVVEPLGGLAGIAILVALVWRRATAAGAIASVVVAVPLFLACNFPSWPDWVWLNSLAGGPVNLFDILHLRPLSELMASLYGLNLSDPSLGYVNAAGDLVRLPVQIKYPLYLLPSLGTIVVVSLLTRQHSHRDVAEFYCRLDTPVGQEDRILAAGFEVDQLQKLDGASAAANRVTTATGTRDERLLLLDFLRLPGLLRRGDVRLSDYRRDILGVVLSIAFIVVFILGIEAFGSLLR